MTTNNPSPAGWEPGGPNPAVAGPPPPTPPPAAPAAPAAVPAAAGGNGDWVKRAYDTFQEGGVFWRPAQWENMPHLFLGIRDLGRLESRWEDAPVETVEVAQLVAFNEQGWCLFPNQRIRQKALYWQLCRNAPYTFGYIRKGEKGNSPSRPWTLSPPDESLFNWVGVWRDENTEGFDPLAGTARIVGRPTVEPPPAPDVEEEQPF